MSSAGTGKICALPIRVPNPSPILDKNRASMGPEIISSTGAGVWMKAPKPFPDSSSVLSVCDKTLGRSFLLMVPALRKLGSVFLLTICPLRRLGLVFSAYGSPTVSKNAEPCVSILPVLTVKRKLPILADFSLFLAKFSRC